MNSPGSLPNKGASVRRLAPQAQKIFEHVDGDWGEAPIIVYMLIQLSALRAQMSVMFSVSSEIPKDRDTYFMDGGPVGVLVLHGFMGSPRSNRPMAEFLHARGLTVHCPRLAGHGHLPARLHRVSHREWLAQAEQGLAALRERCDQVFLVGHSMGCISGARLTMRTEDIGGMVMVTPLYDVPSRSIRVMRFVRHIVPFLYPLKYKLIKREIVEARIHDFDPTIDFSDPDVQVWLDEGTKLPTSALDELRQMAKLGRTLWPRVSIPVLILQGEQDTAVDPKWAQMIYERVASADKTLHYYPNSGHELMRDYGQDHEDVWERVYQFVAQRSMG